MGFPEQVAEIEFHHVPHLALPNLYLFQDVTVWKIAPEEPDRRAVCEKSRPIDPKTLTFFTKYDVES